MKRDVREIDLFRLDLSQFDPGAETCNCTVTINPQFRELYDAGRKEWDNEIMTRIQEVYHLDSAAIECDHKEHLLTYTVHSRPNPLQSEGGETTEYQLVWDPSEGKYFTKGARTFFQFAILFELLCSEMDAPIMSLYSEGIRTPWHVYHFGISRSNISIWISPVFLQKIHATAKAKGKSAFEEEIERLARNESQKRGKDLEWLLKIDSPFYFSSNCYPLCFRVNSPCSGGAALVTYEHPSDQEEHILRKGMRFSPHNVDHYNQAIALLFLFWLFAEEVRRYTEAKSKV
jgi:hypothetical protein